MKSPGLQCKTLSAQKKKNQAVPNNVSIFHRVVLGISRLAFAGT